MKPDAEPQVVPPSPYRERASRLETQLAVEFSLIGADGQVFGRGTADLADLSMTGLRLTHIHQQSGGIPLTPHHIVIVPKEHELQGIWVKARIVRIHFTPAEAELGAEIVATSNGFERLFDAAASAP